MFKQTMCLEFEPIAFKLLVVQTAATVLYICEQQSPGNQFSPGDQPDEVYDPIAVRLSTYENWAVQGYTNAFQAMVVLLYDFVKMVVNDEKTLTLHWFEHDEPRLITDALTAYQEWKTAKVAADKVRFGEHWGDAMPFNSKDWTDQNQQFLAIFRRGE